MSSHRTPVTWTTAVCTAVLLLSSCGGGGSGSPAAPPPPSGQVASVDLAPATVDDYWGYEVSLGVTARDGSGTAIAPAPAFTWASSDTTIATVSAPNSSVTLVRPGTATVTVTAGGVSDTSTVTVRGFERLARTLGSDTQCAVAEGRQRVFCWGADGHNVYPYYSGVPAASSYVGPTPVAQGAVPAGALHGKLALDTFQLCTLTDAGAVYCAGYNEGGRLGIGSADGGRTEFTALAQGEIPAGVRAVDMAVGPFGGCVVGDDGNLYCWGSYGHIPDPTLPSTGFSNAPLAGVAGDRPAGVRFLKVAVNTNLSCALGDDGRAYCWDGPSSPRLVPQGAIPVGVRLVEIQMSADLPCALGDNKRIYCWGTGFGRRFGAGDATFRSGSAPTAVADGAKPAGVGWTAFSLGGIASASCGVAENGNIYCWSSGYKGSLADGNEADHDALTPVLALPGEKDASFTWTAVNCTVYACVALATDRRAYNWGYNQGLALSRPRPSPDLSAVPLLVTRPTRP